MNIINHSHRFCVRHIFLFKILFYSIFKPLPDIKDINDKIYGFMNLFLSLPAVHRDTLKVIFI